ncbi:helix-turn-helix domain-containing protein [Actinomadura rupiterrae]|uniref:helix-turn-helix domain-containing protein n=1 Tax=Actinomadura rupiterrae TaxID=559627 RepID=UPI0020A4B19A|nr:helix-turn-helix transcriptional regulator [Actinomadura rupiterrae]MCP2342734.1 transcriptional regulator with XRE-family HTH domain [Actinomadura rupiterrae]
MTDNTKIGRRVAYWRERRGMTRRHFADQIGRSLSWVEKIEAGERSLVRLPMIERVADALQVSWRVLVDDDEAERARRRPDAAEVNAIKSALARYPIAQPQMERDHQPDLGRLSGQVSYALEAFLASDFAVVGRTLPSLIDDGQRAIKTHEQQRREAAALLVMIYKLAASTLHKFGAHDLAWLAADRAMSAARLAGDPASLARAGRCVGRALMSTGLMPEALDQLRATAAELEPTLCDASPDVLSLVGMVWLAAEIAAARAGDADVARAMHAKAEAIAQRLGPGYEDRNTAFGTANVLLHRVSALVRFGDGRAALAAASHVEADALARLPRERKANFLLDLAEAHRRCGNLDQAVTALWEADETAPQEVRRRPLAQELIAGLWESRDQIHGSARLRQLAVHAGLPV